MPVKTWKGSSNFLVSNLCRKSEEFSEPSQASKTELFATKFNGCNSLTIFVKNSILMSDWVLNTPLKILDRGCKLTLAFIGIVFKAYYRHLERASIVREQQPIKLLQPT